MHPRIFLAALAPLAVLSGCGHGSLRSVVVAPSASVSVLQGPGNYVYVGRQVSTTGTVSRAHGRHRRSHFVLSDGAGHAIALLPSGIVGKDAGRQVRVSGIFDVQFQFGPQLTIQQVRVL
jgi:hypothetical protein